MTLATPNQAVTTSPQYDITEITTSSPSGFGEPCWPVYVQASDSQQDPFRIELDSLEPRLRRLLGEFDQENLDVMIAELQQEVIRENRQVIDDLFRIAGNIRRDARIDEDVQSLALEILSSNAKSLGVRDRLFDTIRGLLSSVTAVSVQFSALSAAVFLPNRLKAALRFLVNRLRTSTASDDVRRAASTFLEANSAR